jgi:hypothetical protein
MKRIVNSYMVSRYIANKMNPGIPSDSVFYIKLLKFTIVLEQWPYRMAWMLLVVENLQQELDIKNRTRAHTSKARRSSIEIGESLTSLFKKILGNSGLSGIEEEDHTKYLDLSLIDIYDHLVQVLMHSSDDSAIQLQRDGDPQVFEQILLDDDEDSYFLMLKDIGLTGKKGCENSLRPYAFNLQRHMVEKVSVEIENHMLVSRKDGKVENIQSKKDDWFASYKKKSSFFDVASNEHL